VLSEPNAEQPVKLTAILGLWSSYIQNFYRINPNFPKIRMNVFDNILDLSQKISAFDLQFHSLRQLNN